MSATSDDGTAGVPEYVRPLPVLNGQVHLAEADPTWPQQYADQAERIRRALGRRAVLIEHVGSTSVPGLPAKPIIDILLQVEDPSDEDSYVPALEAQGFLLHLREPHWHQHRLLKGTDPAVNLHVFATGAEEADRMVSFRDRLRQVPDERELYLRTKRKLAGRVWPRVQDYADAKSKVVEQIIARAQAARSGA